ncbi:cinnamyl-alcohol dehydrogenase [Actinidia rufa]|uniref:Cinnamyl-alcohol dehydrogenase n=1 Tax=Actinidia rufa TaxID=165716 RepID=A0A7J0DYX3_9ERIC|nr:cinnamyl-alcohol dehydrogenase [Actinidia rufa]
MVPSLKEDILVILLFMKGEYFVLLHFVVTLFLFQKQVLDAIYPMYRYCFRIPENYPLALAAPLLCAGITVYTPMMRHNMTQPGKTLGVHKHIKEREALALLGADKFVLSSDEQQMMALAKSFDFIINTASGDIPFDPYLSLLKTAGVLVLVGFPSEVKFSPASLLMGMKTISGSITGGTKQNAGNVGLLCCPQNLP